GDADGRRTRGRVDHDLGEPRRGPRHPAAPAGGRAASRTGPRRGGVPDYSLPQCLRPRPWGARRLRRGTYSHRPSDLCRPALWDPRGGLGGEVPPPVARGLARFQSWMQRHHIDPERDYARFYEHYLLKLPPEHLEILDEDLVRTMAIVGSPE